MWDNSHSHWHHWCHMMPMASMLVSYDTYCYVRQCKLKCIFALGFFICKLSFRMSRGFCYGASLKLIYALSLHSTIAHFWIPCSSCVRWNKRGTHLERINTTINILIKILFIYNITKMYMNYYLSEPCVDCPFICVKPFISGSTRC